MKFKVLSVEQQENLVDHLLDTRTMSKFGTLFPADKNELRNHLIGSIALYFDGVAIDLMHEEEEEEKKGDEAPPEPTREQLREELRQIEGSYSRDITPEKQRRAQQIVKLLAKCICRKCKKQYNEIKARGEYKGFCSAKCQHEKARQLGYRKSKNSKSEFQVLKDSKEIGSVYVIN